ncbi:MAG: hypothetical protein AAGU04_03720 [Anaerolineaceae bacterium]
MENANQIVIHITGLPEDGYDVKFDEFVSQLELVKKALFETQRLISKDTEIAYFRVKNLQKQSPSQVVIEAVPISNDYKDKAQVLVDYFFQSIVALEKGEWPFEYSESAFEAYKELPSLKMKGRVRNVEFSKNGGERFQVNNLSKNIGILLGPDETEYGSYTGMLELINVHKQNIFYIYPTYLLPKLKCFFPNKLKGEVISAVGKFVTVYGHKKIRPLFQSGIPYQMDIDQIEIHPGADELPMLRDLKGTLPTSADDVSSEDFVRGLRNEW